MSAQRLPAGFLWGCASASYQVEGAVAEGGRGASVWDTFSHTPGKVAQGHNGDVAVDFYHRYEEDIQLLHELGFKHYRMSVSPCRMFPHGMHGAPNPEAVQFYNRVIDALLARGIQPAITLYHWDLPQYLEDADGWMNAEIVTHMQHYAKSCFECFGDRVKLWFTFNEPWVFILLGYGTGVHAPGRHEPASKLYLAAHHVLLAHAEIVKTYRDSQDGQIGIVLNSHWAEPKTDSEDDRAAANRSMVWNLRWFMDPIFLGDYPALMKETCGTRLPEFTLAQKQMLQGSADFLGLNHYSTMLTTLQPRSDDFDARDDYFNDQHIDGHSDPSWPQACNTWLYKVPWGFRKILNWIKSTYDNPAIIVTENGCCTPAEDDPSKSEDELLRDEWRVDYFKQYIEAAQQAVVKDGVNLRGYFVWTLVDNFEWADGYVPRFGIVRINFDTLERRVKASARLLSDIVRNHGIDSDILLREY